MARNLPAFCNCLCIFLSIVVLLRMFDNETWKTIPFIFCFLVAKIARYCSCFPSVVRVFMDKAFVTLHKLHHARQEPRQYPSIVMWDNNLYWITCLFVEAPLSLSQWQTHMSVFLKLASPRLLHLTPFPLSPPPKNISLLNKALYSYIKKRCLVKYLSPLLIFTVNRNFPVNVLSGFPFIYLLRKFPWEKILLSVFTILK